MSRRAGAPQIGHLFVVVVLAVGLLFISAAPASACSENGSLFWSGISRARTSTGNQQVLSVRTYSNGCQTGGIVAGGTVHMNYQSNGGPLLETGWRDYRHSSGGTHYYRFFTESTIPGGGFVHLFTSGCASPGVSPIVKVVSAGSGDDWHFYYACNGGGFTELTPAATNTGLSFASPRVETFRFGPDHEGYIADAHTSLHWRDSGLSWHANFGSMTCEQPMSYTRGLPSGTPTTVWVTGSISGNFC